MELTPGATLRQPRGTRNGQLAYSQLNLLTRGLTNRTALSIFYLVTQYRVRLSDKT
jgi:hypothetical protein